MEPISPSSSSSEETAIPAALLERLGPAGRQRGEAERMMHDGKRGVLRARLAGWRKPTVFWAAEQVFRLTGAYARGERALRRPEVTEHTFAVPGLEPALDGLRILHLSDLHLDFAPDLAAIWAEHIQGLSYDLTVFTGDFVDKVRDGATDVVIARMEQILGALRGPRYAVLGNHDLLCVAEALEARGLPFLLNEAASFSRRGAKLAVVGVDDPHFFQSHDLKRAAAGVPDGQFRLLLAHSPVIAEEAAGCGFMLCLSGHTHGGQICLPGLPRPNGGRGIPQSRVRGAWQCGRLQGYTSRGLGASGLPVRLGCPPEIAIHTLCAAKKSPAFA